MKVTTQYIECNFTMCLSNEPNNTNPNREILYLKFALTGYRDRPEVCSWDVASNYMKEFFFFFEIAVYFSCLVP